MHNEVIEWVRECLTRIPEPENVLDLGGRDVNGSVRPLFPSEARYIVVDIRPGPNVAHVANAAEFDTDERFDIVISTECFEHTPEGKAICANAYRLLKPGGYLIVTTAWTCRDPHSGIDGRPLGPNEWTDVLGEATNGKEWYKNVSEADMSRWLADFDDVMLSVYGCDIRAQAKRGMA